MNYKKTELYFLLFFLIIIFIIAFFIFKPFLFSLILAIIFTTVFSPLHKKILSVFKNNDWLAALLTTISVLIVIIIPISFVGTQIFQESTLLYTSITNGSVVTNFTDKIDENIQSLNKFLTIPINYSFDISYYLKQGLGWLTQNLGILFANVGKTLIGIFVFLIALYYLFKDGLKFKNAIIALSPLQDIHDEKIFSKLALAINSVIRGNLTIALIQGILTAIGFSLFGVPNATLFGTVAAIAALIPGVGTALVTIPAIAYLYLNGEILYSIGLLFWGMLAVGLVDNLLGPKLISKRTKLHSFLVLLSILGGISLFGPFGFLLGPLVLSLLFALLEIYSTLNNESKNQ